MLENNRDEINYHKFLKSVRKSQGASLEKTGFGVYTKSGMSRVEAGTRLPDKLVRDRLTARLGISGEEYEEYLLPREYRQWQLRMEIIRCINKKEIASAEEKIDTYKSLYDINSVEKQFIETMRYMVYEMKGYADEVLQAQIYNALICTVPDIDAAFAGIQLLADQELNLIMEYVRLTTPEIPKLNASEWRLKEYNNIVTYVENSRMDKIAQAKVYSKLACLVSELILTEYATEEGLRYALELCTRAIEALRDTLRLYYFVELNEYRMKLVNRILSNTKKEESVAEIKDVYNVSEIWTKILLDLYINYSVSIYMENFTYLYTETECNNVSDVIRARREMMGMPRWKIVNNTCDERTLMRIELEQGNPTMSSVREIFDRMGLCAEYKRARVVTSSAKAVYLSKKMFKLMDNYKHEDAKKCIIELYSLLDMDIPYNEQRIRRQELMLERREKKLDNKYQVEELTDILECTLSVNAMMSSGEKYFTIAEIECIHDFVAHTIGKEQIRSKEILENICEKILDKDFNPFDFCAYELIMNKTASIYGDEGKYKESDRISDKMMKESLVNKKMNSLTECTYNKLWNYQQSVQNLDKDYILHTLKNAYMLSVVAQEESWQDFLQRRINSFN